MQRIGLLLPFTLALGATPMASRAQHAPGDVAKDRPGTSASHGTSASEGHEHGTTPPAVTFAELRETADRLATARRATERFQDVGAAKAAGYQAIGPYVPGMGVHYVRSAREQGFDVANPPILLYERDAASGGLRLAGVSYLVVSPADNTGQPAMSPFPKTLVRWHKHNNICVLPDHSATADLPAAVCRARGGQFTAETSWMLHAWIWKESPNGVFGFINPLVK